MRTVLGIVAALATLAVAQAAVRPTALAERESWPKSEDQELMLLQHAAPVLGKEVTADILWAKTLVYYASASMGEYDFRYLDPYLDAVLAVNPHFKRVYRWAAYAATAKSGRPTNAEYLDSLRYLDQAMKLYPEDHEYFWIAGTRYFLDLQPKDEATRRKYREKGAELIEEAMRKPNAPPQYATLAAAFRTKLGQKERALRNLQEMILTTKSQKARTALLDKLREGYMAPNLADELENATQRLEDEWKANMPWAPPAFYFIMGDRPSPVIDFDKLATERDLFGANPDDLLR